MKLWCRKNHWKRLVLNLCLLGRKPWIYSMLVFHCAIFLTQQECPWVQSNNLPDVTVFQSTSVLRRLQMRWNVTFGEKLSLVCTVPISQRFTTLAWELSSRLFRATPDFPCGGNIY